MSPPAFKRAATTNAARESIDAVVETAPAKLAPPSTTRPQISSRPSWIGPNPAKRSINPGELTMKTPLTIEFESPGLQPPVFIATSLTDPPWVPTEMEHKTKEDGSEHFKISFEAEEGEYQYKLRLGPGDWWVCDESKPTVDDGAGNKNNHITVKAATKPSAEPTPAVPATQAQQGVTPSSLLRAQDPSATLPAAAPTKEEPTKPTMTFSNADTPANTPASPPLQTPVVAKDKFANALATTDHSASAAPGVKPAGQAAPAMGAAKGDPEPIAPLLPHETAAHRPTQEHDDYDSADEEPRIESPLLRHESLTLPSGPGHASLYGQDSMVVDDMKNSPPATRTSTRTTIDPVPAEADTNNPNLIQFPTDHEGIMKHIERAKTNMPEDLPTIEVSPLGSVVMSDSSLSLPSVQESEEVMEPLPTVKEQAPDEVSVSSRAADGMRPTQPITPPLTPEEREAAEDVAEAIAREYAESTIAQVVAEAAITQAAVAEAEVQELVKDMKDQGPHKADFSGVMLALGFTAAVAATALGFWLSSGHGGLFE